METEEKFYPHTIAWIILNRLKEFDQQPKLIEDLSDKFSRLTTHTIYYKFAPLYKEAVDYYKMHDKFPDVKYLNGRFPDGRVIWEMNNSSFSIDMYDKLKKQLDYEIILQDFNTTIYNADGINIEGCKAFAKRLTDFAETGVPIPIDTEDDWLNSYEKFEEGYHGISTGIKRLDEQIGNLNGVVTIAAPSGIGKSTLALSFAYNIATQKDDKGKGRNVLYISYEMPKHQLLAHFAAIESSFDEDINQRLRTTDIKEKKLTPEQIFLYKKYMKIFMQKMKDAGGHITLYDNTAMAGCTNIESFMHKIEEHSAILGRKFDVIFIDNVDSLNMFQGDKGQDEMGKINSFITKLDSFSKTYMDGYGTTIVLLSQTNREGFKKLDTMFKNNNNNEINIDSTVLQKYSALYERATMVLVLYSNVLTRANGQLSVMPVKLRNKPLPEKAITLTAKWEHSYIGNSINQPITLDNDIKIEQSKSDDLDDIELDFD